MTTVGSYVAVTIPRRITAVRLTRFVEYVAPSTSPNLSGPFKG